jgi:hypothetical protein
MKIDLSEPVKPATAPDQIYTATEVKIHQSDPLYLVKERAKEYAAKFGFTLVPSIQEAAIGRSQGRHVLSFREADIAARSKINLSSEILKHAMMCAAEVHLITEDVAGLTGSVYELRSFYNRGVQWFKGKPKDWKKTVRSPESVVFCNAESAMLLTLKKLEEKNMPAWPEEIEHGFPLELCKPDFMTWDQYRERMKNPVEYLEAPEEPKNPYLENLKGPA